MMSQAFRIGIIMVVLLFTSHQRSGCVVAQNISYNGSMHYATGSYFFTENTKSFSFLNGFMVSAEKANASLSVPLIYQNSPWISYGATGYLPTGGSQHRGLTDSTGNRPGRKAGKGRNAKVGAVYPVYKASSDSIITLPDTLSYNSYSFGDPTLSATYKIIGSASGATNLQINTYLKIPLTNPENGFGTGQWDFGLGTSFSQRVLRNNFLYIHLMKWWYGNMPGLQLQNPFSYSFGYTRSTLNAKWLLSTNLSGFTKIINGYEPPLSLSTGLAYLLSAKISLNSSLTLGLTESSPDAAVSLGWSIRL